MNSTCIAQNRNEPLSFSYCSARAGKYSRAHGMGFHLYAEPQPGATIAIENEHGKTLPIPHLAKPIYSDWIVVMDRGAKGGRVSKAEDLIG